MIRLPWLREEANCSNSSVTLFANRYGQSKLSVLFSFSFREIFLLYWGKLIPSQRSREFLTLQDKQNKLNILSHRTRFSLIANDEVHISFRLGRKKFQSYLRLKGSDVLVFNQVIIQEEYK